MTHDEYLNEIAKLQEHNSYWLNAKAFDKIESKAYELGHSSGYSEVLNYLNDLLDFVSDLNTVL
jgi:hypothetical protein